MADRMADILAVHAATQPDKLAIVDDRPGRPTVTYTFTQANERSNQYAALFVDLGVTPRPRWSGAGRTRPALLPVVHAIRKIGAVGVPLNYRLSPEEAAYVIDNCDARGGVRRRRVRRTDRAGSGPDSRRSPTCWCSTATASWSAGSTPIRPTASNRRGGGPTAGATMIYTSGTTGKPKGAVRAAIVGHLRPGLGAGRT